MSSLIIVPHMSMMHALYSMNAESKSILRYPALQRSTQQARPQMLKWSEEAIGNIQLFSAIAAQDSEIRTLR